MKFLGVKGVHPQRHLAEYRGVLQTDAYSGYDALYATGLVTEAAYLAHARRKIHDEHAHRPTELTTEALRRIAELYAIEADIRGSPEEMWLVARTAWGASLPHHLACGSTPGGCNG